MIFNARTNTVFFIDIANIDQSVFEFVYDATEKQSKINERELRKYIDFLLKNVKYYLNAFIDIKQKLEGLKINVRRKSFN